MKRVVHDHLKGKPLRVIDGKYEGKDGWVDLSRGKNGFTPQRVYIFYVDSRGNEVAASGCIPQSSVRFDDESPSVTSPSATANVQRVAEHMKGAQLRVTSGKYKGTGWVDLTRGTNGYTLQSVYIIYVDRDGNEVQSSGCIPDSSVSYVEWCPSATSAIKNQVKRIPDHKKGRQVRVVGGKYINKTGWVDVSRGNKGRTPQKVYIIYVDGGGNEVQTPGCIEQSNVEYFDWCPERSADMIYSPEQVVSSPAYPSKDELIRNLFEATQQLEKALRDEKEKVRRLEEQLRSNASGTRMYIKKENKTRLQRPSPSYR